MLTNDNKNYYELLEITPDASQDEVHKSYIRAKTAYSEDNIALFTIMGKDECNNIRNEIEHAYSVLSIPEKRKKYDQVKGLNQLKRESISDHFYFSDKAPMPDESLKSRHGKFNTSKTDKKVYKSEYQQVKSSFSHSGIKSFSGTNQDDDFQMKMSNDLKTSRLSASSRFSLNFDVDPEFEQTIEKTEIYSGAFLKKIREYKKVDINRISKMTNISKTYISNLESDDFIHLPVDVYTRGFVYQYAKVLKLNPDYVASSYMAHLKNIKNSII